MDAGLTAGAADRFAAIALGHVEREFPNKLDHVLDGPGDARRPRELHPIFFGSFDWHSCVHGYWTLATVLRRFPQGVQAGSIAALMDRRLTFEAVAGEMAYLERPSSRGFERPYGWAWLMMLQAELERHDGRPWAATLRPLAAAFAARLAAYLPKLTYPIRAGTHANTAFALRLALDYCASAGDEALGGLIRERLTHWFAKDQDCRAWEPSGDDFLSPALMEAEAMRAAMDPVAFGPWLDRFLPRIAARAPATLVTPALVSDPTDGKIAHLDGLNLSRAWCWRALAGALEAGDPRRPVMLESTDRHLAASLGAVAGDYMGEHWLASFALLALGV